MFGHGLRLSFCSSRRLPPVRFFVEYMYCARENSPGRVFEVLESFSLFWGNLRVFKMLSQHMRSCSWEMFCCSPVCLVNLCVAIWPLLGREGKAMEQRTFSGSHMVRAYGRSLRRLPWVAFLPGLIRKVPPDEWSLSTHGESEVFTQFFQSPDSCCTLPCFWDTCKA